MTQQIEIQQTPTGEWIIHQPQFDVTQVMAWYLQQGKEVGYLATYNNQDIYYCDGDYFSLSIDHQSGNIKSEEVDWVGGYTFPMTKGDDGCYYLDQHGKHVFKVVKGEFISAET